jgi:hypothetical protein
MTLFIVLSICSGLDARDCRVVESYRAPPGFVICGVPGLIAHRIESDLGPRPDEFLRVRCSLR